MALGQRILGGGTPVVVQPAVPSVATEGEIGAVLFDGEVSHTIRKGAILPLGGGLRGGDSAVQVEAEGLRADQERVVATAVDAVSRIAVDRLGVLVPLLYARVDLVRAEDRRNLVLEVELNEPSFFLPVDVGAADRFVDAILRHVGA
jgi:hypothetical protein